MRPSTPVTSSKFSLLDGPLRLRFLLVAFLHLVVLSRFRASLQRRSHKDSLKSARDIRQRLGCEAGSSHAGGVQGHSAGGRWRRHARNDGRCAENCAGASGSEAHEGAPGHQHLRYAQAQSARQNAPALVQGERRSCG